MKNLDDKISNAVKDELKKLMNDLGYKYLKHDIAKCYLPNIKSEFLEVDDVRVFHFLFTEFIEFYDKKVVK